MVMPRISRRRLGHLGVGWGGLEKAWPSIGHFWPVFLPCLNFRPKVPAYLRPGNMMLQGRMRSVAMEGFRCDCPGSVDHHDVRLPVTSPYTFHVLHLTSHALRPRSHGACGRG